MFISDAAADTDKDSDTNTDADRGRNTNTNTNTDNYLMITEYWVLSIEHRGLSTEY